MNESIYQSIYLSIIVHLHNTLKFSHVLGQTSENNVISILPAGRPPIATSKKTTWFDINVVVDDDDGDDVVVDCTYLVRWINFRWWIPRPTNRVGKKNRLVFFSKLICRFVDLQIQVHTGNLTYSSSRVFLPSMIIILHKIRLQLIYLMQYHYNW